ncbi:MAG TPA: SDR family oxidoreductase, partial [Flavobacteriales bacterium]|nr:SDR family oxidoreductase [Flavobacteriales bacterium]
KGRTAVITGGAGILGKHFSEGLASCGSHVVVVDLNEKEGEMLAADLTRRYGQQCISIACDVSEPASVNSMVDEVVKQFGDIHVLHNNAASKSLDLEAFFAPFEEYTLDQWREVTKVNLDGMFLVAQAVGKKMVEQNRGGSIIQTASIYGVLGPDPRVYENSFYLGRPINTPAVYSASKAAVIGLTKHLATYWADQNIRVNCLTPGGVESGQNDSFKEKYSSRVPLGRMAQAEEMVGALLYLASDASSYVTGQNIIIDGGLSAW